MVEEEEKGETELDWDESDEEYEEEINWDEWEEATVKDPEELAVVNLVLRKNKLMDIERSLKGFLDSPAKRLGKYTRADIEVGHQEILWDIEQVRNQLYILTSIIF